MTAYICYNDDIIENNEIKLMFWFECKICHERWMSAFCYCPKCNKVNKFKILSGEQAYNEMQSNAYMNELYMLAIYGLLNEEYK
jgi:hypothetical protein